MAEEAVVLEDLTKKFGDFTAVNGISLSVSKGEIFGFLGANGAGKSTTIRMLCGILKPTSGRGVVGGVDITRTPEKVKDFIGYMSQKFSLYNDLTIAENLDFYSGIYAVENRQKAINKALESAGLSGMEKKLTGSLPMGWKQRLALACSVMHGPSILFLDEPTSGVDPNTRRKFWAGIKEMALGGTTVFVTTHYMLEAEYCDRISIMKTGKVVALGSPEELKEGGKTLEDVFISLVKRDDE
ncbi:MAG: ATP-binding cassette domain-containing protein [Candidatus Aegiribacteria sp.]|nr:ATP-binding cassette domain-containing protein [Candidatus Aegiribacteria sp.]MBD3295050.1 ATP-binding cassette domain-containing protein [Candidatus Fermentibacteria bacterium]